MGRCCQMTDVEILQKKLLRMMKELHHFLENENIPYYMLGGTSLGAFRHNGFIPWDDDIDIGIPRRHYDRLIKIADRLPEGLVLMCYQNTEGFPYNFAKIVDSSTTLIEKDYVNNVMGVFIDVFPLDGACSNAKLEKIRQKRIYFWHSAVMSHFSTTPKKGIIKKVFKVFAELMPAGYLRAKADRIMKKYAWDSSEIIANYMGSWHEKEVMSKSIFGKPTLHRFEDCMFYTEERIADYLEKMYGDYMKLPSAENRVFRHGYYYFDVNTPYSEYKK